MKTKCMLYDWVYAVFFTCSYWKPRLILGILLKPANCGVFYLFFDTNLCYKFSLLSIFIWIYYYYMPVVFHFWAKASLGFGLNLASPLNRSQIFPPVEVSIFIYFIHSQTKVITLIAAELCLFTIVKHSDRRSHGVWNITPGMSLPPSVMIGLWSMLIWYARQLHNLP